MQKAGCIFGCVHHVKSADVERVHLRQVRAAALLDCSEHRFPLLFADSFARQEAAQHCIRGAAVDFRQHVDQKLGLRSIVRRIAVDLEEAGKTVDQVIDRGCKIRSAVAAAPLVKAQPVTLVFFERRGVEDAQDVVIDAHGFYLVGGFARRAPVKRVDVLQDREDFCARHLLVQQPRKVTGGKMRLTEEHKNHCIGMPLANLLNFAGCMPVTSSDLAQIFARHAIQTVDGLGVIAGRNQQLVKWSPIVAPVQVEADALAEFAFINLAAPPFVENMLVAGKDGLDSKDHAAVPCKGSLLDERSGVALGGGQSMVVPDQNNVGGTQGTLNLLRVEERIIVAESLVELPEILAS